MQIAPGAMVAVVDGEKLSLFSNEGDAATPKLAAVPAGEVTTTNRSGGVGHMSRSANPDTGQQDEDSFAAGVAELLNAKAIEGKVRSLIVIAAPRTLGELRKHYHSKLKDALAAEISKDLTGQTTEDIEKAIAAA